MGTGKNIKKYRELKGMGLRELARLVPIAPSAISKAEREDRTPDTENLFRIAEILEVPVEILMGEDETNHVPIFYPGEWQTLTQEEKKLIQSVVDMVRKAKNRQ